MCPVTSRGRAVSYIDVTPTADRESSITAALAEIAENRAVIEQVKGMLMLVYRVNAEAAFDLLRWRSQETNIKLRVLAEQLLADVRGLRCGETVPTRAMFDQVLMTVHQRIHQ
jgi:hypothetical protein